MQRMSSFVCRTIGAVRRPVVRKVGSPDPWVVNIAKSVKPLKSYICLLLLFILKSEKCWLFVTLLAKQFYYFPGTKSFFKGGSCSQMHVNSGVPCWHGTVWEPLFDWPTTKSRKTAWTIHLNKSQKRKQCTKCISTKHSPFLPPIKQLTWVF